MKANPILLQKKYARVIALFSKKCGLSLDEALDFFYRSTEYQLLKEGIASPALKQPGLRLFPLPDNQQ